ncbi:MAG: hypothetical protein HRT58_15690 [Crocinitomicaceae bacterium]|nr:hypothetical protein [Flavobacteriales bacterium]NQZ37111.1 hypothetical protein [Crocinitomicaceae bacterium]
MNKKTDNILGTLIAMKYNMVRFIISFLFLQSFVSSAQPGPDDIPCDARSLSHFTQFSDSIEFRVNCYTEIDFTNEMCGWSIAEDYFNTVPLESSKLLCVVYFKNEISTEEIELIRLFDEAKYRDKFIDRIQLMFVYDPRNAWYGTFKGKEEILKILTVDIRAGITDL